MISSGGTLFPLFSLSVYSKLLNSNENLLFNDNFEWNAILVSLESTDIFLDYQDGLIEIFLVVYS